MFFCCVGLDWFKKQIDMWLGFADCLKCFGLNYEDLRVNRLLSSQGYLYQQGVLVIASAEAKQESLIGCCDTLSLLKSQQQFQVCDIRPPRENQFKSVGSCIVKNDLLSLREMLLQDRCDRKQPFICFSVVEIPANHPVDKRDQKHDTQDSFYTVTLHIPLHVAQQILSFCRLLVLVVILWIVLTFIICLSKVVLLMVLFVLSFVCDCNREERGFNHFLSVIIKCRIKSLEIWLNEKSLCSKAHSH